MNSRIRSLFVLGLLISILLPGFATLPRPAQASTLDCTTATSINVPVAECQALLQLYDATGGPSWANSANWDTDTNVDTWYGVTVFGGTVTMISLTRNNLVGSLPDLALPNLVYLYLYNNQLSGVIPDFTNLPNLAYLRLDYNQLSGAIPDFTNLPILGYLALTQNQLSGAIPDFTNLPILGHLILSDNQLSGAIPDFTNLPILFYLILDDNQLSGAIPNFTNLPNLTILNLDYNQLSGAIPDFTNLPNLNDLWLGGNQLSGAIPDFTNLPNLFYLYLNNNQLSGELPTYLDGSIPLGQLDISNNQCLVSSNPAVRTFVTNLDADWETTQACSMPPPAIEPASGRCEVSITFDSNPPHDASNPECWGLPSLSGELHFFTEFSYETIYFRPEGHMEGVIPVIAGQPTRDTVDVACGQHVRAWLFDASGQLIGMVPSQYENGDGVLVPVLEDYGSSDPNSIYETPVYNGRYAEIIPAYGASGGLDAIMAKLSGCEVLQQAQGDRVEWGCYDGAQYFTLGWAWENGDGSAGCAVPDEKEQRPHLLTLEEFCTFAASR